VYSKVLKGAEYMNIAQELESCRCPLCRRKIRLRCCARISTTRATRFARNRDRVRQCESLGEFAVAEDIREILRQEQEHQIDLATALGEDPPDVSRL